jgi:hypothetical protein
MAVLMAVQFTPRAAIGQTLTGTTAQTEPQKPDLSLSNQSDHTTPFPFTGTLTPLGDWRCCLPPGRDDIRVTPPRGPNAPNVFGGGIRLGGESAAFSVGAVGSQNLRLPLFMSTTIAGSQLPVPDSSFFYDASRSTTNWQVVASATKNLFTSKSGRTVGVSGDVFLPVGPQSPDATPVVPLIPSRAVRFGLTLGF